MAGGDDSAGLIASMQSNATPSATSETKHAPAFFVDVQILLSMPVAVRENVVSASMTMWPTMVAHWPCARQTDLCGEIMPRGALLQKCQKRFQSHVLVFAAPELPRLSAPDLHAHLVRASVAVTEPTRLSKYINLAVPSSCRKSVNLEHVPSRGMNFFAR